MIKLTRQKFDMPFEVIDKGSGTFYGALEDLNLSAGGTLDWVPPRRILKVPTDLPIRGGMVIQTPEKMKYMVAFYSPSETAEGSPFRAFKLYQATVMATLQRRTMVVDARTGMEREGPMGPSKEIYASFEPLQEAFDRELRIPNEKSRFITNEPIMEGDVINGLTVIEAHEFLGLWGAVLG